MDRAINKTTNEIISAFKIFEDGSYQNLNKYEWIAPRDSIDNWEELDALGIKYVPVHYVREAEVRYKSGKIGLRAPHFSICPNSPAKVTEESQTHKILKNWLFERLKNNDLEIRYSKGVKPHKYDNKLKLSELNINWNDYEIEVTTKGTKKLRADILIPFKKKDLFLGNGIIFEIQISYQSQEQIYERTIERALHGYSVAWLFEKDFVIDSESIALNENIIKVQSFSEQLHFAKNSFVKKLKNIVEDQCRFLDYKIRETNNEFNNLELRKQEMIINLRKIINDSESSLIEKINSLKDDPFNSLVELYKKSLENKNDELIEKFNQKMNELNFPFCIGECKKCGLGYMSKKITRTGKEVYSCSNYPECKHSIWIN